MLTNRHTLACALVLPALALLGLSLAPAPAFANSLDNTDPYDTGCWTDDGPSRLGDPTLGDTLDWRGVIIAYIARTAPVVDRLGDQLGYVENWYSNRCGTNWTRMFVDGRATETVWTTNLTTGTSTSRYTIVGHYSWSNQVYAFSDPADACGNIVITTSFQGTNCAEA